MPHKNKQMASFFLTTRCNLRCIYCYNREERSQLKEQTLPLDIAKAGVDYYFTNSSSIIETGSFGAEGTTWIQRGRTQSESRSTSNTSWTKTR